MKIPKKNFISGTSFQPPQKKTPGKKSPKNFPNFPPKIRPLGLGGEACDLSETPRALTQSFHPWGNSQGFHEILVGS